MKKKRIVALGSVLLLGATIGCSYSENASDTTSVVYRGGATGATDKEFKYCVKPSISDSKGLNDADFKYPANTRDFTFPTGDANAKPDDYVVVTKDSVALAVNGIFNFALNISCEGKGDQAGGMLRKFHEQIGTHYGASNTGMGQWDEMLKKYVGEPLQRALDDASKQYNWIDLYSGAKKPEWEKKVADLMTNYSKTQVGGNEYWCSPNFRGTGDCGEPTLTVQQPTPTNKTITDALSAAQAAVQKQKAAVAENAAIATQAEGIKKLVAVLGPQGYVLYQAMLDGRITLMPIPQGGSVNLNPPAVAPK